MSQHDERGGRSRHHERAKRTQTLCLGQGRQRADSLRFFKSC